MKVTYMGKASVSFADTRTGELVEGLRVYYSYPDPNVEGMAANKFFIKKGSAINLPAGITPGKSMNLDFNMNGKVCGIG